MNQPTTNQTVRWTMKMAGWYTNAPAAGDLRTVDGRLRYSDEYEDWWNAGNVEYHIKQVDSFREIGGGWYRVGSWLIVVDAGGVQEQLMDVEFDTLADAKAYADRAIAGEWY